MKDQKKLTPVMQQYLSMKEEAPNAVLMFRLGDFYEAFFEDAIKVSAALDLVLTHRGLDDDGGDIPMCGIPWHAADNYFGRLVRAGYSVALAEQLETPEEAKNRKHKQINRGIVRVITPGTLTDDVLLSPRLSNFLVVVSPDVIGKDKFHIAGCDISTGEFFIGETKNPFDEMVRLSPAEVLYPEKMAENDSIRAIRGAFNSTPIYEKLYNRMDIKDSIIKYFPGVFDDSSFTITTNAVAILAAYLENTQRGSKTLFKSPYKLGEGPRLLIDAAAWRSLEIDESIQPGGATLLDVLDETKTAAGARKLRKMLRELSGDINEIKTRQSHIGHFLMNRNVLAEMQMLLGRVPDIMRAMSRLSANRGVPRDLRCISEFMELISSIKAVGRKLDSVLSAKFDDIKTSNILADKLHRALEDSLPGLFREGGIIKAGYDASLDNMNQLAHGSRELIAELQAEYIKKTGVNTLKIKYNNILGYYIEVPAKQADKLFAPDSGFIHRQTLVGNVRFTTGRLIELDNDVRGAAEKAAGIEEQIIASLISEIMESSADLLFVADLLADADVFCALATAANDYNWVRPNITQDIIFDVKGGRHPVVEKILKIRGDQFVKNDCLLTGKGEPDDKSSQSIALITGPNMAGKSTYLRQNALIVILAHLGSFVPADSAVIGICDQLFSRVGASDNLAAGQSTFMVEMSETATILRRATEHSFIIFDEIGRGTATFDGLSIAWAVLEFLDALSARALFATHYHELTGLEAGRGEETLHNLKCLTVEIKEFNDEIIFMHKIMPGVANRSYGIHVAKMAGMPDSVVFRAAQILSGFESDKYESENLDKFKVMNATPDEIKKISEPGVRRKSKVSDPEKKSQLSLFGE